MKSRAGSRRAQNRAPASCLEYLSASGSGLGHNAKQRALTKRFGIAPNSRPWQVGRQPEYAASAMGVETVRGSAVTNNGAAPMLYLSCWVPRTVSGLAPSLEASSRALIYARGP